MEVRATLRYLRISPRKVRLVIDGIRGMEVQRAEHQLQFHSRQAARPVLKLLRSAIANAENNNKLERAHLFVKKIVADEGPTLKRFRPRAFGSAAPIRKRSTHITIILDEKKPHKTLGEKQLVKKKSATEAPGTKPSKKPTAKTENKKTSANKPVKKQTKKAGTKPPTSKQST